jgi:hypothetical protein
MKSRTKRPATALLMSMAIAVAGAGPVTDAELAACRNACQKLGSSLMAALGLALKEGGPAKAIGVCRDRAPALAADISKEEGLMVRRTGLRIRNPANAPDAWERQTLEGFQKRLQAGEESAALEFAEVTTVEGNPTVRYMKAILVAEPCLKCHGEALDPTVAAAVAQDYPEDRATGFKVGELRGAFSVRLPLTSPR